MCMILALQRLRQGHQQLKPGRPHSSEALAKTKEENSLSLCSLGQVVLPLLTSFAKCRGGLTFLFGWPLTHET